MSNFYDINFDRLVAYNTPAIIFNNKWLSWINVLINPLKIIYTQFKLYIKMKEYELSITPQVCYLEKLLNDRYDFSQRRIYIDDGADKPVLFLYARVENKPNYFRTRQEAQLTTVYTRGENGNYSNDFIVYVPAVLGVDVNNITALIKVANNLPGTKFKIEYF